jgi:hypothetical protein
MMSGANHELWDPTIFWLFNSACCLAMLDHVGFTDLKIISNDPNPFVVSGRSPEQGLASHQIKPKRRGVNVVVGAQSLPFFKPAGVGIVSRGETS